MDGTLIVESLRAGAELTVPLRVRRIARFEVADATPAQPGTWALIEFEGDDQHADALASAFADALRHTGGWYADFHTAATKYVVFAGRVFRYPRGDVASSREAQDHARSVGVPETQLDWAE